MIYRFKRAYEGVDPQAAGEELERIRIDRNGHLRTLDIVLEAAEPSSPIHAAFTWDDQIAAHEFRLTEARQFVKNLVVKKDENSESEPAYWNVRVSGSGNGPMEQYYQSSVVIAKSPLEYASALSLMQSELFAAQSGLEKLLRLAPRSDRTRIKRAHGHVAEASQILRA